MSAAEIVAPAALTVERPAQRSTSWWGMVLLIVSESTLFACAIASYYYVRFTDTAVWPPDGTPPPKLLYPSVSTAVMLASAAVVLWADRGVRRGRVGELRAGLLVTALLGLVFLTLEGLQWKGDLKESSWTTDAYSSLYYCITGLHDVHVAVGVLMLAFLLVGALRGRYGPRRHEHVHLTALYWYFNVAVWVAVYAALYLSPRW